MANYIMVFVISCVMATSMAAINRNKRQVGSMCLQGDGRFPMDGNCKQFIDCEDGAASLKVCPDRLVFNPQTQTCDHAGNVQGCQNEGNSADSMCDSNPGKPGESWKVAHPSYCNAFYTCESHYIHRRCEFCGEGTYFSEGNGFCLRYDESSPPAECTQKQVVPHSQKSVLEVYPDCNLFQTNPFQRLVDRIQSRTGVQGGQPTFDNRNPTPVQILTRRNFGQ